MADRNAGQYIYTVYIYIHRSRFFQGFLNDILQIGRSILFSSGASFFPENLVIRSCRNFSLQPEAYEDRLNGSKQEKKAVKVDHCRVLISNKFSSTSIGADFSFDNLLAERN